MNSREEAKRGGRRSQIDPQTPHPPSSPPPDMHTHTHTRGRHTRTQGDRLQPHRHPISPDRHQRRRVRQVDAAPRLGVAAAAVGGRDEGDELPPPGLAQRLVGWCGVVGGGSGGRGKKEGWWRSIRHSNRPTGQPSMCVHSTTHPSHPINRSIMTHLGRRRRGGEAG